MSHSPKLKNMEAMEIFHDKAVEVCSLSVFKTSLSEIALRDYKSKCGIPDGIVSIDLDSYENSLSGDNEKTVDAAVGIANYENNKFSNPRLLLVELRLNYTGDAHNSSTKDMKKKEQHSRNLLIHRANLDPRCFFIFDKSVAPKRLNIHNRLAVSDTSIKKWIIVSPEGLKNLFFLEKDLPYIPQSNISGIEKKVESFLFKKQYDLVFNELRYWMDQDDYYYCRYNLNECKAIQNMLEGFMVSLCNLKNENQLSEDETFNFELLSEEFLNIKKRLKNALK